ncbi:MAG: PAS domain-containing protein [Cyanobacteria bacterium P01_A01_bin.123]
MPDAPQAKLLDPASPSRHAPRWGVPLRLLLIAPFVVQVVIAVAATGWLAHRNGQRAVQDLATQLLGETSDRIKQELNTYTDVPPRITQANADALALQQLDPNNLRAWSEHFYRQSQYHDTLTFIYFGDEQGRYVELEKQYGDRYKIAFRADDTSDTVHYRLTQQGKPGEFLRIRPYAPRQRPWYQAAIASGKPVWTEIYEFTVVYPTLGLSFVQPYYDTMGNLQGVVGADFTLQDISGYLDTLSIGKTGKAFIIERDGDLIASSFSESAVGIGNQQKNVLSIHQSLIRETANDIKTTFGSFAAIDQVHQLHFEHNRDHRLVQITPYADPYGLDWLLVVVIPESDFTAQIETNNRNTLLLCLLSLGTAVGLGILTAHWVSHPLSRLGQASQAIAQRETHVPIAPSWIREVNLLVQSFNRTGADLDRSRSQLETYSQQLEVLVDQRTQELRQSEEKFTKAFEASPNAVAISTFAEGRYLNINDRCAELFGRPKAQIIGRTSTELGLWTGPTTRADYLQQLKIGPIRNHEWQLSTASGEIKTVLISAEVLQIQGQTCIFAINNDISDRKHTEEQLRQSEERWQLALKGNNDGIWDWNIATNEIFYSTRLKAILGYGEDEMANLRDEWQSRVHPEDLERVLQATQAHLRQETPYLSHEYRLRCKDGHYKWILDRGQALWDAAGNPVRIVGSHTDISDRKRVEEKLHQNRASLATAQRIAHVGNWSIDLKTKKTTWSAELLHMFGFDLDDPPPSYAQAFRRLHPEDHQRWRKLFRRLIATGTPYEADLRIALPNGEMRYIEGRGEGLRDEQGKVICVFGTGLDITERKQAAEKLRQSEASLAAAQRVAHVGSWEFNVLTRQITWSAETFRIFGLDPNQAAPSYERLMAMVHADDRRLWDHVVNQSLAHRVPHHHEFRLVRPSGEIRHAESRGEIVLDDQNQVRCLFGVLLDISERKQAEAVLDQQFRREQLLTSITNQIRQSLDSQEIYQTTADLLGQALQVSRSALHVFEAGPPPQLLPASEYCVSSYASVLNISVPLAANPHAQTVLATDRAVVCSDVYQDSQLAPILSVCEQLQIRSMAAVRTSYRGDPNGTITLHQCDRQRHWSPDEIELLESVAAQVGIAIAQAHLLEQELAQKQELARKNADLDAAKQAAEKANQVKSKFLASMSHELRTPLNAILGFAQVMQRDLHQDSLRFQQDAAANLGVIQTSGDHLLALINDILDMAKIEAGYMALNPQPFDLHALLEALNDMFHLKANAKDIALIVEWEAGVPQYIKTDPSKLRQVLINLLGNAVKFTQVGEIALRVKGVKMDGESNAESGEGHQQLAADIQSPKLSFTVSDTGPGIPANRLKKLFKPFYQTELGRQSQSGTGLGLTISQTYVRLMGGELQVTSHFGQGSTFYFSLPAISAEPDGAVENRLAPTVRKLAPNQPAYRILVVEDKWESRTLLVKLLEPLGFEVREAKNGQEAVQLWEHWQPHLIWMDMRMPVMDGYEATQRIRGHVKGQAPAIIALTASALEQERNVILSAGCNDFVHKPFRDTVIFDKLQEHLGVEYVYDDPVPSMSPRQPIDRLTAQRLVSLPLPWLTQLHEAASLADADWVSQLVAALDEADPEITTALLALVKTFRCDRIEALAATAIAEHPNTAAPDL